MSFSFTLSGKSSVLSYNFNPPIYLEDNMDYEIGLTNFDSYNSIPNVDVINNKFLIDKHEVIIPVGAYEINALIEEIEKQVKQHDKNAEIEITPNPNTSKLTITSNRRIDFNVKESIGPILGFDKKILEPHTQNTSDVVNIFKINSICILCNVASGSFLNGVPVHIIHQFFPTVPVGYKIVESPQNIIYFPVSVKAINNITLRIIDQDGDIVNFREEIITIRLHLRKVNN